MLLKITKQVVIHFKNVVLAFAIKAQFAIDGFILELELIRMLHKVVLASLLFILVHIRLIAAKRHILVELMHYTVSNDKSERLTSSTS